MRKILQKSLLIRNTLTLSAAFLFGRGMSLIWQVALSVFFIAQTEILGQYAALVSLAAIATPLADFGMTISLQQFYGTHASKSGKIVSILLKARGITGCLSALIFFLVSRIFDPRPELFAPQVGQGVLIFISAVGSIPACIWESQQKMKRVGSFGIIQIFLTVIIQAFLFSQYPVLFSLICGSIVAALLYGAISWLIYLKEISHEVLPSSAIDSLISIIRSNGMPIVISAILYLSFMRVDVLFISRLKGDAPAGVFALASLVAGGFTDLLWSPYGRALFPRISAMWINPSGKAAALKLLSLSSTTLRYIGLTLMTFSLLLLPWVSARVYPSGSIWLQLPALISLLLGGFWLNSVYGMGYRLLILEGKRNWFMYAVAIALFTKLASIYFLISALGIEGAALSGVLSLGVLAFLIVIPVNSFRTALLPTAGLIFYIASTFILYSLTQSLSSSWISFSVLVTLSFVMFSGLIRTIKRVYMIFIQEPSNLEGESNAIT